MYYNTYQCISSMNLYIFINEKKNNNKKRLYIHIFFGTRLNYKVKSDNIITTYIMYCSLRPSRNNNNIIIIGMCVAWRAD